MNSNSQTPNCPVCSAPMSFRMAQGRKSGKRFIMIRCPVEGRHFRGFITDQDYVKSVLSKMEGKQ